MIYCFIQISIGYPIFTLGIGCKSYVHYRLRLHKKRVVAKENEFYYSLLKKSLGPETCTEYQQQQSGLTISNFNVNNNNSTGSCTAGMLLDYSNNNNSGLNNNNNQLSIVKHSSNNSIQANFLSNSNIILNGNHHQNSENNLTKSSHSISNITLTSINSTNNNGTLLRNYFSSKISASGHVINSNINCKNEHPSNNNNKTSLFLRSQTLARSLILSLYSTLFILDTRLLLNHLPWWWFSSTSYFFSNISKCVFGFIISIKSICFKVLNSLKRSVRSVIRLSTPTTTTVLQRNSNNNSQSLTLSLSQQPPQTILTSTSSLSTHGYLSGSQQVVINNDLHSRSGHHQHSGGKNSRRESLLMNESMIQAKQKLKDDDSNLSTSSSSSSSSRDTSREIKNRNNSNQQQNGLVNKVKWMESVSTKTELNKKYNSTSPQSTTSTTNLTRT